MSYNLSENLSLINFYEMVFLYSEFNKESFFNINLTLYSNHFFLFHELIRLTLC